MYIAIHEQNLTVIAAAHTAEQAMLHAEIVCPEAGIILVDHTRRSFAKMTCEELRQLLFNTTGATVTGGSLSDLSDYLCQRFQKELIVDETPTEILLQKLERIDAPSAWQAPLSDASVTAPPKKGSTTGRVWEIADRIAREKPDLNFQQLRGIILQTCIAEGINDATAGTQYARWKKSRLGS